MTDVNKVRKEIADKYSAMCQKISHTPNNSLVRYLSNPIQKTFYLDLIFRGNDKTNFNNRLTDRDIILLTSAVDDYKTVLFCLSRLSDISISLSINSLMWGWKYLPISYKDVPI